MADDSDYRTISREYPDGRRIIAALKRSDEPPQKTDDEILDDLERLIAEDRPHAVDDE